MLNSIYDYLIVYYILSCIVLIITTLIKGRKQSPYEFIGGVVFLTFIPFAGLLFYLFLFITKTKTIKTIVDDYKLLDDSEIFQGKYLFKTRLNDSDYIVPIEEALILNDNKTKRSILLNALKQDASLYVEQIKAALKNSDTETSHYAAAALMELKRKLTISIHQLSYNYENNRENLDDSISYAEVLKKFICSEVLDERNLKKYNFTYANVLANINRLAPDKSNYFVDRINTLIALQEYTTAEECCEQFLTHHAMEEEPFMRYLKLYYTKQDSFNFEMVLNRLKSSNIVLSHSGLSKIRFWINEGA